MILKAYFKSEVPDILFVPINFSYDRVLEENLFAFELLGVPKPKESTSVSYMICVTDYKKYVYYVFINIIHSYDFITLKQWTMTFNVCFCRVF